MFRKADTMNKLYKVVLNKPIIQWVDSVALEANLDNNYYLPKYLETREHLWNSGLEIKTLSTLVNNEGFVTGSTPDYKEKEIKDGAVLLKTVNIERNELNTSKLFYISKENHGKLKKSQLNKGDLVITVIGATDEVIGRAIVYDGRFKNANITQSLAKFRVREQFDEYFVSTFLNSKYGHNLILQMSSSSTRRYVNNTELGQILVPIPSNEIQKYIGNKVRKAEELREEAKRLKEEAESLLSLVLKLDEFKYEVTKSWVVNADLLEPYLNVQFYNKEYLSFQEHLKTLEIPLLKMSQVLFKIIRNNSPDENDRVEKGIPSLIVSDIDPYRIEIENAKIQVSQDYYKANEHQAIRVDDVVYTTAGPPLGEACLVVDEMLPLLSGAHVAVLRTNEKCKPGYLTCVLNSLVGSLEVQKHSYGIRQQYLFNEQLSNFVIPIIAQEIQDEIHEKISKAIKFEIQSKKFISEAKQDVEDLIEGKFNESKVSEGV